MMRAADLRDGEGQVVKSVDRPNRSATIKHEKVANYMGAMTMPSQALF